MKIIKDEVKIIQKDKCRIKLNKPTHIGASKLEISKLIHDFHDNYTENKCDGKAELIFTDTDSLMYNIETVNIFEDLYKDK